MAVIGGRAYNIEMIHTVGQMGYPFVEISLLDPEESARQIDDLLQVKEEYGLTYLAHYPNEDNPTDPKVLRERFVPKIKQLLDISQKLGIEKGTIHFWIDVRWASPALISEKIELLSEMVAHASQKGITLCIENLTEQHESFSLAFEAIADLRMTLDIGHGELLSKENTSFNFIRHLFPNIAHVHTHDNHGGKGVEDDLHLPLGQGRVDYPRILTMLKDKGYSGTVTMEVKPPDMAGTKAAIEQYL